MQIVDNSTAQYQHFFLQGHRAVAAGAGAAGLDVEKIGVLVVKQGIDAAGTVLHDKKVLLTDELYPGDPELIRLESDITLTKPLLDIVVVNTNTDVPEFVPAPVKPFFGRVEISRANGTLNTIPLLDFGWRLRTASPGRLGEAGDAGSFVPDINQPEKLPANFSNSFFNGGRNTSLTTLASGDQVLFQEIAADGVTPTGFEFELIIPPSPQLVFKADGVALDPQPALEYGVDTAVFDQTQQVALFTWRAVFNWNDSFESTVLEIN